MHPMLNSFILCCNFCACKCACTVVVRSPGGGGGPSLGDRPPGGGGGPSSLGWGTTRGGGGTIYNPSPGRPSAGEVVQILGTVRARCEYSLMQCVDGILLASYCMMRSLGRSCAPPCLHPHWPMIPQKRGKRQWQAASLGAEVCVADDD